MEADAQTRAPEAAAPRVRPCRPFGPCLRTRPAGSTPALEFHDGPLNQPRSELSQVA